MYPLGILRQLKCLALQTLDTMLSFEAGWCLVKKNPNPPDLTGVFGVGPIVLIARG